MSSESIAYTKTQSVASPQELLRENRLISSMEQGEYTDAMKILGTQVLQRMEENHWGSIAVTSPRYDTGKTTIAINLGLSRKDGEVNTYWDEYISRARSESYKFLSWNVWDRSNLGASIGNQTATFPIWHEWILVFARDRIELNKTKKNKTAGSKAGTNRQANGTLKKGRGVTGEWGKMGSVIATSIADGKLHPAMFPVELPEAYIKACSKKGEIIYEPFTGSGTTIIASEKLDRIWSIYFEDFQRI